MGTEKEVVVEAAGLTKIYRKLVGKGRVLAVDNVSFEVRRGEVFGILGPNGSGKTTTLKALLGLVRPTKGQVRVLSKDPRSLEVKAHIGFLPEESYLYRFLNADETLQFVGKLAGLSMDERRERIEQVLDLVGLTYARKRTSRGYSKGMARRLGLAQVLLKDPDIILLDEPTLGMDPVGSREIKDLIHDLKSRGKTIILSSHLLMEIENVCDRLAILDKGAVIRMGDAEALLEIPNRYQIIVENCSEKNLAGATDLMRERGANVLSVGHPKKSLDDFFLETLKRKK